MMEIEQLKGQLRAPLGWRFYGIGSGIEWLFVWE